MEYDEATGATRSLSSHTGYLSAPTGGFAASNARSVAIGYVQANAVALGLSDSDLAAYEVTDNVYSQQTGATHVYLRQLHQGLPVYNGQLHINVNREGRIISVNNAFMPEVAASGFGVEPSFDLATAVASAARHAGIELTSFPATLKSGEGVTRRGSVDPRGISVKPIEGQLMWLPIRRGEMRLVWNFQIATRDRQHWYDMTVDAITGQVWTRFDWVASDSYRVYQKPVESPSHTLAGPLADGRVLLTNPANATASPFGWHDTNGIAGAELTTTQGNNAHAYTDTDNNNSPDIGSSPDGGASLNFDSPLDLNLAPSTYQPAAVANLFYWNNIIHDVQHRYGFDEAAGNFQSKNYGLSGAGNDYVLAEAQDGGGTNNANFATPPDGSRPRMQMYVWTAPTPDRDGDFDNGIVVHEYGHGISNRLVGGPSNTSCLGNTQQPGEGLSDWWALAYTAKVGDTGPLGRGIGTYALNQPTTGPGIRTQRYSTDPAVNTWTYASINGMAVPHGVGSVWAQGAWEVYWALVNNWGFNADLYDAQGSAGNQRAMLYVNEGLKNAACSPTFTQVRDGIIQAATDNHGGEDVCRIWTAFAGFGLGINAVSGGANSTTPTNGFAVPVSCGGVNQPPVANAGADQTVPVGALVTLSGSGSYDPDSGPSPLSYAWSQVSGPVVSLSGANTVNASFTAAATAANYVFQLQVSDGALQATDQVAVTATFGIASYDPTLKAPKCGSVNNLCDSGALLNGRAALGPEPSQPNTINNSCADGTAGTFHLDESNDRIKVSTLDGTNFAAGKSVKIEATVWAYSGFSSDWLDIYQTSNASAPTWTLVATIQPTASGAQTLSANYTLPTGSLQAVRARFRYLGAAGACLAGSYDDHDDLIFAVSSADTTAPTTSITSPTGGTVSGTTTINADASDDVGVTRVDFLVDDVVIGNDTTFPYSFAWNTATATNAVHTLTTKAYDAANHVGTSDAVSVTVSNIAAPVTVFYDGAESSSTTFVKARANNNTQWTRQASGSYAGTYRWKAGGSKSGNYGNNGNATLSTPTLNLSAATTATLTYAFQHSTQFNSDYFDVLVSTNGGTTYTSLLQVSGDSLGYPAWVPLNTINLNAYAGQTNVKVRFRFTTNGSVTGFGVAIDEVKIVKQ